MSLNHKEIDAVLAELPLEGSHIQKVRQPDFKSLVFDLYRPKNRFSLFISLNQGKTRVHRLTRKVPMKTRLQRFSQFLRSRIQGGRIIEAYQIGSQRIIKLLIRKGDDTTVLWVRLWGGDANIIATDTSGSILDAFYRRPKRDEISGSFYNPETSPPPGGKKGEYEIRNFETGESFNDQVETYYWNIETAEALKGLKTRAAKVAEGKLRSAETLYRNIENRLSSYGSFEEYREYGDLLKSNLYRIQKGADWFETENFYREGIRVRIELDPHLSPEENAEKYYKQYKKGRRAVETLREDLNNARVNLERLKKEGHAIAESTDIDFLKDYLEDTKSEKPSDRRDEMPGLLYSSGGFIIRVGRSSKENDTLLRRWARGNDFWIHARDWPGAYVFIRAKRDKSIPLDVLLDAGNLALHYSRGKASGRGDLYYTRVKYLRRAKEGKTGLVIPTMEKNLTIDLDEKRLSRLFSGQNIANTNSI